MNFETISGATGTVCTKSGLYKATDKKAQYIEIYTVNEIFRNFPGGKGTKSTTWYHVTGTSSTTTVSDTDGTVVISDDGGFTSVVVEPGTA